MNPQKYRNYVLDQLTHLERKVEISVSLNRTDLNLDCEDFYRELLNLLYGLNLKNSNHTNPNQDTFDLCDDDAGQVYQITSSVNREKVRKTIRQFEEKYSADYDELYMVFIKRKNALEGSKRQKITEFNSSFGFSVEKHLLDNLDIIKKFDSLEDLDEKKAVYELVRKYFDDTPKEEEANEGENYSNYSQIPKEDILNKLYQASHHLIDYSDSFVGVPDSHFQRRETLDLLNWIEGTIPPNEKPVALLVGGAGRGKTVILKDLLLELRRTGIPVVGLKADRYYAESLIELEQKVHLEDSFEKVLRSLTKNGAKAVVLIDQIDALSQSLSAKRQYIDAYNLLVRKLITIPNVRVILSVRSYDLNYDTDLSFYKNQRSFPVGLLEPDQVFLILGKLGIEQNEVPQKLLELLQTPHHLNVFCKVYRHDLKLTLINTLHDLYNELWYQYVTEAPRDKEITKNKLQSLLFAVAKKMYESQHLSIPSNSYYHEYDHELTYLKSSGVLLEINEYLQFFHQSFFDFAFAKYFVDGGNSISKHLQDNHQGLFVRSSVKMILAYLREQNHGKYIQTLKKLLFSPRYRLHLKIMILNILGYQAIPSIEEKNLIKVKILNSSLRRPFLESVNSSQWLVFLIREGEMTNLLNPPQKNFISRICESTIRKIGSGPEAPKDTEALQNLCFQILRRHLPNNRKKICDFLWGTGEFQDREAFIFRTLYFIKEWDVDEAFSLFKNCQDIAKQNSFAYCKILGDILPYNFDFVTEEYKDIFQRKIEEVNEPFQKPQITHDDEELFKKMFRCNAFKAFEYFLPFIEKTGELPFLFFDYGGSAPKHSHGLVLIVELLLSHVRNQASNKPEWFKDFFKARKFSDFSPHQIIIIEGLRTDPRLFHEESFEFLKSWTSTEKVNNSDGKVQHFVRKLLGEAYPILESSQKEELDWNLLNISPKAEKEMFTHEKKLQHRLGWYGYTQFLYLSALPQEEVFAKPHLQKRFNEFHRKFGEINDREPNRFFTRGIEPPIDRKAYENMSHEDWIATFEKYDENYKPEFGTFKGSLFEHSRAFENEVKRRPEFFMPLVRRLVEENKVHQNYITAGLSGLKEAKFNPNELQKIFQKAITIDFDVGNILQLISITSYFTQTRVIDESTLDFLIELALKYPDPESNAISDDLLMDGANNVRGASASRIAEIGFNPEFENKVFNALEKIANDRNSSVKVAIIHRLANLRQLNESKALNLFLTLVNRGESEVLKYTGLSAQFFAKSNFDRLIPYFKDMIEVEGASEHTATILSVRWIEGQDKAYPLLKELLKRSDKAKVKAIEVSVRNLEHENEEAINRCRKLYCMFLSSKSDEVAEAYNIEFLHFPEELFYREYPTLKKYSRSPVCKKQPQYYLEYLLRCAKKHPVKCLHLLKEVPSYEKPDITQSGHYDDEPVKILIGAYNSLNSQVIKPMKDLENSMKLFDKLLKDERFRPSANKAIELVDR